MKWSFFRNLLVITWFSVAISSCSNYQKVLKSTDYELKRKTAMQLYNKKDYQRAYPLLEELVGLTRGTAGSEDIYFYYCYCNYYLDDLVSASYHFEQFAKTYPSSARAEEAAFMNAYCYFRASPASNLDQTSSRKAIEEMQLFINKYPNSARIQECNDLIDKLRLKLEDKAFDQAKLYFRMMDYKAAMIAFRNMIKDYPNTRYKDQCMLYILKAGFELAENSIESKKAERYQSVVDDYNAFLNKFADSKSAEQAKSVKEKASNRYNAIKQ